MSAWWKVYTWALKAHAFGIERSYSPLTPNKIVDWQNGNALPWKGK